MTKENKWTDKVAGFETTLCKIMKVVCGVWFAGLIILIILQVFTRFVLKSALPWTDEGARYLWLTLCFLGCGFALSEGHHIEINVIGSVLKKIDNEKKKITVAQIIDICKYIVTLGMSCLLVYLFYGVMMGLKKTGTLTAALRMPMWIVYLLILIGFVGVIIHSLCRLTLTIFDYERVMDPNIMGGEE